MKRVLKYVGVILGIFALGLLIIAYLLGGMWDSATEVNKDLGKYEEVVTEWETLELVDHFPRPIPSNAKNLSFSSFPGFLQGGAHIYLGMELPESEVSQLYNEASNKAKQFYDGGHSFKLLNEREDGLPGAHPKILGIDSYEFPDDYRIFIYDARSTSDDPKWNHGEKKGMVISLERNEVIYYAEKW